MSECGFPMVHRSDVKYLPPVTAFVIARGAFRVFGTLFIVIIDVVHFFLMLVYLFCSCQVCTILC